MLRKGSRGRAVTEVQNALNGTLRPSHNLKPDGIFGSATDAAVRAFQSQARLSVDGIVGPVTRSALGLPGAPPFTHRVRLHFRSLSLTNVPFERILSSTQSVYAPYGIKVEYGSGVSLGLSEAEERKFQQIDGSCTWNVTGGEYAELMALGGSAPATDIVVYYVQRFSQNINGCGGHLRNRPACIVAAAGTRWCTAHEIGHVLLTSSFNPVHHTSRNNLMFDTDITRTLPTLTAAQVAQIQRSPCCKPV